MLLDFGHTQMHIISKMMKYYIFDENLMVK